MVIENKGLIKEATCTAADGVTEVYTVQGLPLMVRAVDFNRVYSELLSLKIENDIFKQYGSGIPANINGSTVKTNDGHKLLEESVKALAARYLHKPGFVSD